MAQMRSAVAFYLVLDRWRYRAIPMAFHLEVFRIRYAAKLPLGSKGYPHFSETLTVRI